MTSGRAGYDDVVVTTPVTVPYVRYSIRGAHWFLAGALDGLLKQSGLGKEKIDGLSTRYVRESGEGKVGKAMSENALAAIARAQSKDEMRALATGLCFAFMQEASMDADPAMAPEANLTDTILFGSILGPSVSSRATPFIHMAREDRMRALPSSPTITCASSAPSAKISASFASRSALMR